MAYKTISHRLLGVTDQNSILGNLSKDPVLEGCQEVTTVVGELKK